MVTILTVTAFFASCFAIIVFCIRYQIKKEFRDDPVRMWAYIRIGGKRVHGYVKKLIQDDLYIFVTHDHHYYKCRHWEMKPMINWSIMWKGGKA